MWLTRGFIIVGAGALLVFFVWPWVRQLDMDGQISISVGGLSAHMPAVVGVFATISLAAMLFAVKR